MKRIIIIALASMSLSTLVFADWSLDKSPDLGAWWQPLGPTPIYANSFVYEGASGERLTSLGVYLRFMGGGVTPDLRYFLLADSNNSPTDIFLSTSIADVSTDSTSLVLLTAEMSAYSMTNGTRYWVAAQKQPGSGNSYQVGGHTQNSVQVDDGTFWWSTPNDFNDWDGQGRTPEMAFNVQTAPVPAPASLVALGFGISALIVRRRRRLGK